MWGKKWLVLREQTLSFCKSETSTTTPSTTIELSDVTSVTREDLKPFCLAIATTARPYYLALKSDEELYAWMDDIYARSSLMGVSSPTNSVHQVHVGVASASALGLSGFAMPHSDELPDPDCLSDTIRGMTGDDGSRTFSCPDAWSSEDAAPDFALTSHIDDHDTGPITY
ncbi:hypothetical protein Rhopal_006954-T1 [Rhodotorula paludigena]|uniref:PH domain-containing protein n=1 Tax=Rhodotorula paludigena TaxID=86838 RepID=A0AAV5GVD7_9BASI|nr:hypothetical protein Rhopal_006954-T1 [Rhodotorula paludigena]